mgnify:CR=1 FL=1
MIGRPAAMRRYVASQTRANTIWAVSMVFLAGTLIFSSVFLSIGLVTRTASFYLAVGLFVGISIGIGFCLTALKTEIPRP